MAEEMIDKNAAAQYILWVLYFSDCVKLFVAAVLLS